MIRFSNVSLRRGAKLLLDRAEATLYPGERIGLIGANGSGKSSLFALLRGELHADKGDVEMPGHWRLAHVAQETPALERPALEYAIDGDTTLRALEARLAETHDGLALGELHAALADADAYTVRSRAATLLMGLGFKEEELERPVSSFSGGWRMRLNLAQALMCPSDLMLLDEPTNHLDLDAIIWLEEWLKRYPGTLLLVSHDRDFLDAVVTGIVHIDQQKLRRYSGDYSSFEAQRAQGLQLAQSQIEKQQRERAHLQSFIDRFRAKATKARQAQSRMKMLAKMEELAPLHVAAPFSFEFREPLRAPNPLLVLEEVEAGYGEKVVLRELSLSLQAEQRIGLLGVNGAGKSTFIKTVAGVLPILGGDGDAQQGPGDRLLRAAPGRDAARRRVAALASHASRARHPGAGAAQLPRQLQLSGRHGDQLDRALLRRREGAPRARAHRLAAAQPAAPRRADQSSRPRDARGADRGARAIRGHAGARFARPAPAAREHRAAAYRRRRHGPALRRRSRRLPRGAALAGAQAQAANPRRSRSRPRPRRGPER